MIPELLKGLGSITPPLFYSDCYDPGAKISSFNENFVIEVRKVNTATLLFPL